MNTTAGGDVTYESKTVRVVRGTESRTIAKLREDGWEVTSQSPGTLRTEITFRRPAPKSRRTLWIVGGGVAALAIAVIFGIGIATENRDGQPESSGTTATESALPNEPTDTEPAAPQELADVVLTPENSPDFAAILALTDTCSPDIAAFAAAHSGQTISFPGSVVAFTPYEETRTRYLILINAGDFSETFAVPGPDFQFRDVNTSFDLQWIAPVPDTIGVGTNLTVKARVDRYEERSCLFLLDPIATAVR